MDAWQKAGGKAGVPLSPPPHVPDKAPVWPIFLVIALALAGACLFLLIFPKG